MNSKVKVIIAGMVLILTTGCDINTKSPEQLTKKPIYNSKNQQIYKGIDQLLSEYTDLFQPFNIEDAGKINEIDLDGDEVDEVVVFKKKEDLSQDESKVGFMVLSKNEDTYIDRGSFLETGENILYADFYDIDNDGNKEIIMLIDNDGYTNMYIYRYMDKQIKRLYKLNPYWISNKEDFSDLKIFIQDINDDLKPEIVIMNHNPISSELSVAICNYEDSMNIIDHKIIDNVKEIDKVYIEFGKISSDNMGIILDTKNASDSNYTTNILYLNKNKEINILFDEEKIVKSSFIRPEDINGDSILDIPVISSSDNNTAYQNNKSMNVSWYNWNGNEDKPKKVFVSQVYYNYEYNFKISIPNILHDRIYVEKDINKSTPNLNFYYYDVIKNEPKNLFTITIDDKKIIDDKAAINPTNNILLSENEDYRYKIEITNDKELEKLNIEKNELINYFSLIYK